MDELKHTLVELGYTLNERQPHLGGERRVFAADKFVLFGIENNSSRKVVIKASKVATGIHEITRERVCREALKKINFAYGTFATPKELLFTSKNGYALQVTEFIEQDMPFLERPIQEQFRFALVGLKAMEAAHAATYEHLRSIRGIFPTMHAKDYVSGSGRYKEILATHADDIERYCGFLTHFDFMPQNFRISGAQIYLLDHSSLRFGNKHESWARLINFMVLHHPQLAEALLTYVQTNRSPEEIESLKLMRIFRLNELIAHHAAIAERVDGDFHKLSRARVLFWEEALQHVIENKQIPEKTVTDFKATRDMLRSPEEKDRQKGLH